MTTINSVYKMTTINGDTLTPVTIFNKLVGEKKFLSFVNPMNEKE